MKLEIREDSTALHEFPPPGLYEIRGLLVLCYRTRKGNTRFRNCETGAIVNFIGGTAHIVDIVDG